MSAQLEAPAERLATRELELIDAYWRAANYLSVGQIYLLDNPLLAEPLTAAHVKPRLLGHWRTTPGLEFLHARLTRSIRARDLDTICVTGPGHGGPALAANTWLEGSYGERHPDVSRDTAGMARSFQQFSFPGGIPSHVAPDVPGSINEGAELDYSLAHAYGAVVDNPDLIAACVIGDGEAETGPLAASWHSNKFLDPRTDGAVLPILHLNGYRIANPTVLARIPRAESTRVLGAWLRDVLRLNADAHDFRIMGPDETESNRLTAVFEATDRAWVAERAPDDEHLSPDGRVMEVLSEHMCQGWLEGYLLTGRHGFFNCYEAFIHIVDSTFNQHAKRLRECRHLSWRAPIASLNILLTSHVWRQDHNGFSHQDPGFLDVVANKGDVERVYLAPDANSLLCVADRALRSGNLVNVIVARKQPQPQWLDLTSAIDHRAAGIGIFEWASSDANGEPDVVLVAAGDVPALEVLAAVDLLRRHLPELAVRVVNVVDLMTLQPPEQHPSGLPNAEFDALSTPDMPVIFAFHGYPWLIHRLTYRRTNHHNLHVRGYKERGTTTTPFDMVVPNDLDRFHLVMDVIDRVPKLGYRAASLRQLMRDKRTEHRRFVTRYGRDMPEVEDWVWQHDLDECAES